MWLVSLTLFSSVSTSVILVCAMLNCFFKHSISNPGLSICGIFLPGFLEFPVWEGGNWLQLVSCRARVTVWPVSCTVWGGSDGCRDILHLGAGIGWLGSALVTDTGTEWLCILATEASLSGADSLAWSGIYAA